MGLVANVPSKDEVIARLAKGHRQVNEGVTRIHRLVAVSPEQERDLKEPVKLLEVSSDTAAVGVQPIYFQPSGDIFYPSVVVAVTPDEYDRLLHNPEELARFGWQIGDEIPA